VVRAQHHEHAAQRFLGHMMQLRSLKAKHYESGDGSIDPP